MIIENQIKNEIKPDFRAHSVNIEMAQLSSHDLIKVARRNGNVCVLSVAWTI